MVRLRVNSKATAKEHHGRHFRLHQKNKKQQQNRHKFAYNCRGIDIMRCGSMRSTIDSDRFHANRGQTSWSCRSHKQSLWSNGWITAQIENQIRYTHTKDNLIVPTLVHTHSVLKILESFARLCIHFFTTHCGWGGFFIDKRWHFVTHWYRYSEDGSSIGAKMDRACTVSAPCWSKNLLLSVPLAESSVPSSLWNQVLPTWDCHIYIYMTTYLI